jgi:hypothetical protein
MKWMRGFAWLIGALVAFMAVDFALAEPRTSVATFDGGRPAIESPTGADTLVASDVVSVDFWLQADAGAVAHPQTVLQLVAPDVTFSVVVAADRKSLTLIGAGGSVSKPIPVDLSAGQMIHLALVFGALETYVYVDAAATPPADGVTFLPADDDASVSLLLGGIGFTGKIGSARVWSAVLDQAAIAASRASPDEIAPVGVDIHPLALGQTDGGALSRPGLPQIGLWHGNGVAATIPVPKSLPGIPDVNHGEYREDEAFFALFASDQPFADFGVASSKDLDNRFFLKRDPASLGEYAILDSTGADVGRVRFQPSGKAFRVLKSAAGGWFDSGLLYKTLEVPLDGDQFQQYGEAWQVNDKPKNFEHSVIGCYDSGAMNPFDYQEHGCSRRFFREPWPESHRFDTGRNNLTIPWGWKYVNISETRAHSFSAMAATSSEIGGAIAGGSGFDFAIGLVSYNSNKIVEQERESIRQSERLRAYHQFVARRHSIIVDAKKMMLDPCFLRDVARVGFALNGRTPKVLPPYFRDDDTAGGECDALLNDALTVSEFVQRYSDLYAYAITYGARAVERIDMDTTTIGTMVSDETDVSSALEAKITGSAGFGGLSANFADGGGFSSKDKSGNSSKVDDTTKFEFEDLICVGGGNCSGGQVDVSDNPVPIYLDLRPITDLLGPPYFADPDVIVTVRQAVAAALKATRTSAPRPDIPLVRMFDVTLKSIDCGSTPLNNTGPLTTQQSIGFGPFAPGRRFAGLPNVDLPSIGSDVTTIAAAQASLLRACPASLSSGADAEFVVENGANSVTAAPAKIVALPGLTNPKLSDVLAGKKIRIVVPMFDAALGGGPTTHPGLYLRLRPVASPDAGNDACAAPCGFAFQDPQISHNLTIGINANNQSFTIDDTGPDYALYPAFEAIDLTTLTKGKSAYGQIIGRGASNIKGLAAPTLAYWAQANLEFDEITDYEKAIGY